MNKIRAALKECQDLLEGAVEEVIYPARVYDDSFVFNTGYQAAVGAVSASIKEPDVAYNHFTFSTRNRKQHYPSCHIFYLYRNLEKMVAEMKRRKAKKLYWRRTPEIEMQQDFASLRQRFAASCCFSWQ
ncbi:MAG: hypothetical protein GY841_16210 [FCB group bacterium]|nr:hypothetical protein [FCB group bacterium]